MRTINVYPGAGGWIYEVRISGRVVVFGRASTSQLAHWRAAIA
jgi:hypothetical protein